MGWQDAPEVGGSSWSSAPVVGEAQPDLKKKLASETSDWDAFKIGAGKTGDSLIEGLKQSGMGMGAILSELLPGRLKSAAQEELAKRLIAQEKRQAQQKVDDKTEYAALEEAHPKSTLAGEVAPALAAPMLRAVSGPGAATAAVNSGLSAALPAALEYGTAEERAKRAAVGATGGVVGSGLATGAGKVFSGITSRLTPEAQRLATLAEEKFGIPLGAAEKTGNKALQSVDAALEHMPVTSGAESVRTGAKADAFTKAMLQRMGVDSDEATAATFGAGKKAISGDFERIFGKVHVKLDDGALQTKLGDVVQNAVDTLPQEQAAIVVKRVGQIIDKVDDNGAVAGKAYQAWRSQVQDQAEKTSDGWLGKSLKDLYKTVDEQAYKAAADVGEDAALKGARLNWRNMRIIEPLVAKSENGRLSPSLARGEAMKRIGNFAEAQGDEMVDLVRAGRAFVADQVPNSGTAQRALAQSILSGGTLGSVGWAASGDPGTGAKMALGGMAGGFALPKAAQMALRSKAGQGFLMGDKALSPLEMALMERAARMGAIGVAQGGE